MNRALYNQLLQRLDRSMVSLILAAVARGHPGLRPHRAAEHEGQQERAPERVSGRCHGRSDAGRSLPCRQNCWQLKWVGDRELYDDKHGDLAERTATLTSGSLTPGQPSPSMS